MVESVVLHPAMLIAAGFECITSRQARFLNAYRVHFGPNAEVRPVTQLIKPKDFALGGILNPQGDHQDPETSYYQAAQRLPRFPYLNRQDILYHFYAPMMDHIWSEVHDEIFGDLEHYCAYQHRPRDYFQPVSTVIHALRRTVIFDKVSALHHCGVGDRLVETFRYVFDQFRAYDRAAIRY